MGQVLRRGPLCTSNTRRERTPNPTHTPLHSPPHSTPSCTQSTKHMDWSTAATLTAMTRKLPTIVVTQGAPRPWTSVAGFRDAVLFERSTSLHVPVPTDETLGTWPWSHARTTTCSPAPEHQVPQLDTSNLHLSLSLSRGETLDAKRMHSIVATSITTTTPRRDRTIIRIRWRHSHKRLASPTETRTSTHHASRSSSKHPKLDLVRVEPHS